MPGHARRNRPCQEFEIAAAVGLLHRLVIRGQVLTAHCAERIIPPTRIEVYWRAS
jgi:hypothetical protein